MFDTVAIVENELCFLGRQSPFMNGDTSKISTGHRLDADHGSARLVMSANGDSCYVLYEDGEVYAIGYNHGQLGVCTGKNIRTLTKVRTNNFIVQVAGNDDNTLLLDIDGKLHHSHHRCRRLVYRQNDIEFMPLELPFLVRKITSYSTGFFLLTDDPSSQLFHLRKNLAGNYETIPYKDEIVDIFSGYSMMIIEDIDSVIMGVPHMIANTIPAKDIIHATFGSAHYAVLTKDGLLFKGRIGPAHKIVECTVLTKILVPLQILMIHSTRNHLNLLVLLDNDYAIIRITDLFSDLNNVCRTEQLPQWYHDDQPDNECPKTLTALFDIVVRSKTEIILPGLVDNRRYKVTKSATKR